MKMLLIGLLVLGSTSSFAEVSQHSFGQSCLITDEDIKLAAILDAKRRLHREIVNLNITWRSLGITDADVGASKSCPAITVGLDSQSSIEKVRGKKGDFYDGFPVIYRVEGEIRAL